MAIKVLLIDNNFFQDYETWKTFSKAEARKSFKKYYEGQWELDFVDLKDNVIVIGHQDGTLIFVKQ